MFVWKYYPYIPIAEKCYFIFYWVCVLFCTNHALFYIFLLCYALIMLCILKFLRIFTLITDRFLKFFVHEIKCTHNAHLSQDLALSPHLVKNRLGLHFEESQKWNAILKCYCHFWGKEHYMQEENKTDCTKLTLSLKKKFIQHNKVHFVPKLLS